MAKKADVSRLALDAALELAATTGWRDMTMADVAAAAGVTLAQLHAVYRSKGALLDAFSDAVDAAVLEGTGADLAGEPARDRLFDVLMRRYEALRPHRAAVRAIARACSGDPLVALGGACRLHRAMRWMLEAAGIDSSGIAGGLRTRALAAIHLDVMRVWLADDSEDMGPTMAALDRRLAQADRAVALLCRFAPRARGDRAVAVAA